MLYIQEGENDYSPSIGSKHGGQERFRWSRRRLDFSLDPSALVPVGEQTKNQDFALVLKPFPVPEENALDGVGATNDDGPSFSKHLCNDDSDKENRSPSLFQVLLALKHFGLSDRCKRDDECCYQYGPLSP